MKNKHELSQFLSDYCDGCPPKYIYEGLCAWEKKQDVNEGESE